MASEKFGHSTPARVHPKVAEHFQDYPVERLWYLLFDYNRRNLGPAGFENPADRDHEQGYLSGMFSGLDYVLATIDVPLSGTYLEELHDSTVSKITYNQKYYDAEGGIKEESTLKHAQKYRDGTYSIDFGLITTGPRSNVTLAGFKKLLDRIRKGDNYFCIERSGSDTINLDFLEKTKKTDEEIYNEICANDGCASVCILPKGHEQIFERLGNIIREFNTHVMTPGISEDEKIRAIAICVQEIELTHPFPDGNCRTMLLLLNKLLIQHNLSPTIIENPNRIDAFSIDQLCAEIKKGQDVFRAQKQYPRPADLMVKETDDRVVYLKNNPNVTALLVHAATEPLFTWDQTNIGDRNHAVELWVSDLCIHSPALSAVQVEEKEKEINSRVFDATYKRGMTQFFSSGNMLSEVIRSASHGELGKATHMVFGGNQYGIDFEKLGLDNDHQLQGTHPHSRNGPS